jgi:adenosylhomocysteine nucleosidase
VKGVSDALDEPLPDFARFISAEGKLRLFQFIGFVCLRPGYWPALLRLGRNSRRAARNIKISTLAILKNETF